ncbi:bcl-2-modifying factor isoform X2 [Turdus rufiventris]|nr:bcl-2-modifying factor isoform X2 [Turdus rufiventris]
MPGKLPSRKVDRVSVPPQAETEEVLARDFSITSPVRVSSSDETWSPEVPDVVHQSGREDGSLKEDNFPVTEWTKVVPFEGTLSMFSTTELSIYYCTPVEPEAQTMYSELTEYSGLNYRTEYPGAMDRPSYLEEDYSSLDGLDDDVFHSDDFGLAGSAGYRLHVPPAGFVLDPHLQEEPQEGQREARAEVQIARKLQCIADQFHRLHIQRLLPFFSMLLTTSTFSSVEHVAISGLCQLLIL